MTTPNVRISSKSLQLSQYSPPPPPSASPAIIPVQPKITKTPTKNTSKNLYLHKSKVFSNSKPVHQNFNTRALTISRNILYHHKIHPQHEKSFLWKPHTLVPNIIFHPYKIKPQNHNLQHHYHPKTKYFFSCASACSPYLDSSTKPTPDPLSSTIFSSTL